MPEDMSKVALVIASIPIAIVVGLLAAAGVDAFRGLVALAPAWARWFISGVMFATAGLLAYVTWF